MDVIECVDAFTEGQIEYLTFHGFRPVITPELSLMIYCKNLASNKLEIFYTYYLGKLHINAWIYESNTLVYRDKTLVAKFKYFSDFRRYINRYLETLSTSH